MFGVGSWEIVVILVVALLVLGPDQLPKIAKMVGKAMREVRRASSELRMNLELDDPPARPRPVAADEPGKSPTGDPELAKVEVERAPVSADDPYAAPTSDEKDKPPTPKAG